MSYLDELSDIGDSYAFGGGHTGYRGGLRRSRTKKRRKVRSRPLSDCGECQDLQGQRRQEVAVAVPSVREIEAERAQEAEKVVT